MNTTYRPDPVPIDTPGEPAVRLIPLGGLGEIGLNMMLIESGDDIIAVDCGLMFPDDEMPGVDFVIPDFTYLRERRDGLPRRRAAPTATRTTSARCPYLLREFPVPVYGTPLTLALARAPARRARRARAAPTCAPTRRAIALVIGGFTRRADPRDALDRRRHRPRHRDAASAPSSTPATSSSTRHPVDGQQPDYCALRRAGRARRARALLGLDQRRPAGAHRLGDARSGEALAGRLRGGARAHHRRDLRLAHPPHPAGARPGRARAAGTSRCSARA